MRFETVMAMDQAKFLPLGFIRKLSPD